MKRIPFGGKMLRVNLSSGKISTEPTAEYAQRFLGGRGINEWILYNEVMPGISPFDPANKLLFGAGVLCGTLAPTASRLTIEAKHPGTNGIGSANVGGHFASELKFAGYDHIVIEGKSDRPVYLWIDDDQVELTDASHLWGRLTGETNDLIEEEQGKAQIACIGPGGENLNLSACIMVNRGRAAGRCGMGAVMGSKNLKAIAVRGTGSIEVTHPDRFMRAVHSNWAKIYNSASGGKFKLFGTSATGSVSAAVAPEALTGLRTQGWNFQDIADPNKLRKLAPEVFRDEYEVGRWSCSTCPWQCSHVCHIKSGPYAGTFCEGIQSQNISNFGARLAFDDPAAVLKAHSLLNEYGLDQDTPAGAIGWAMECYQRGILTQQDADGLELTWGNHEVVMELLRKIAYREGFGEILADGSKRASEIVGRGSDKYAVLVKGQDSMEFMRGAKGWALGSVVSPRGGTHLRGASAVEFTNFKGLPPEFCKKTWGVPVVGDSLSYEHKAKLVVYYECFKSIMDILGICIYGTNWYLPDLMIPDDAAELYSAATGNEMNTRELMEVGRRLHNLEKAFNVLHAGFDRQDDYPPKRLMEEPVKSGPLRGERLPQDKWDKMLDEYYEFHGWSKETGWQTRRCLEELDLREVADDLEKAGRLASDRSA